jgi:hypothetical protein
LHIASTSAWPLQTDRGWTGIGRLAPAINDRPTTSGGYRVRPAAEVFLELAPLLPGGLGGSFCRGAGEAEVDAVAHQGEKTAALSLSEKLYPVCPAYSPSLPVIPTQLAMPE